jgi:DNA-binding YbaB/EbfC family protein
VSTPSEPGTDLSALLQQAQAMQSRLLDAQEELARAEVTGSAGGGLVHATVTGGGEVVGLRIDPAAIDPGDAEGLADLVLAAIRDGNRAASELQNQTLAPLAETMGGLSGMGGMGGIGGTGGSGGGTGGGLGLPGR